MGETTKKVTKPRWSIGITLAIILMALTALPAAGIAYYVLGQVQVEAADRLAQTRTVANIAVAVAAVLALVIAIAAAYGITRPIRRMRNVALAVAKGDPFAPSDVKEIATGRGEIGHLGQAFSDMVVTLHRRMTELSMAYEIGQDITASVDVDETLQAILDRVNDVVAYDAAEITLYDQDDNKLLVTAWRGKKGFVDTRGKSYKLGVGLTGTIAKERKSLLIGDAHAGAYEAVPTGKTGILTIDVLVRSILGVPLIIHDRLVGTLELVSSRPRAFSENDQRLLETIAPQGALAIEKAQQVREREQKLQEEIKLLRIEIDQTKRERQVSAITESDYFRQLSKQAAEFRARSKRK
jgi:nitrate/nitrite-specific signal transduction histidine kinase